MRTKKQYTEAVEQAFASVKLKRDVIYEKDILHLPDPLQAYLKLAGVIGKTRMSYFKITMAGEMKLDRKKPYAPIKATQYTFLDQGIRLFYITMRYKGLPISGIHHYKEDDALMTIKLLDLVTVANYSGEQMQRAETVTYFNDLCLMAPGALIDEDITWEVLDHKHVKAIFNKHGHTISATLVFDDEGMLCDFISPDRMAIDSKGNMENILWSTPMSSKRPLGDYYLADEGYAVWHYPDGQFPYIHLKFEDIKTF